MDTNKYYAILGVSPGTLSKEALKKVYKTLAKLHHPDRSGGDEAKFKEITEAYEIITGKRQPSRSQLREEAQKQYQAQQSQPTPCVPRYNYEVHYEPRSRPQPRRGRMVEYIADSYDICEHCRGGGQFVVYCNKCHGTRNVVGLDESGNVSVAPCKCKGGISKSLQCEECAGRGKIYVGKKRSYRWEYE